MALILEPNGPKPMYDNVQPSIGQLNSEQAKKFGGDHFLGYIGQFKNVGLNA